MMDDFDHIGEYVTRHRASDAERRSPLTKAHLVETRVEDRFGTHCGRQLGTLGETALRFDAVASEARRCKRC